MGRSMAEMKRIRPRQSPGGGVSVGLDDAYTLTVSATSLNSAIWSKFM